jgi:hypothetical protein
MAIRRSRREAASFCRAKASGDLAAVAAHPVEQTEIWSVSDGSSSRRYVPFHVFRECQRHAVEQRRTCTVCGLISIPGGNTN